MFPWLSQAPLSETLFALAGVSSGSETDSDLRGHHQKMKDDELREDNPLQVHPPEKLCVQRG